MNNQEFDYIEQEPYVVTKVKNGNTVLKIIISIVIAVAALLILVFATNVLKKRSGMYNGFKWGSSYEEVEEKLKKDNYNITSETTENIIYVDIEEYDGKSGVSSTVKYYFDGGILTSVLEEITNEDSIFTDMQVYDEIENNCEDLYGEPTGGLNFGKIIDKKDDGSLYYYWLTSSTRIDLARYDDGDISISYTDIDTISN